MSNSYISDLRSDNKINKLDNKINKLNLLDFFNATDFNFRKIKHKEFRNMYITEINSDKEK